MNRLYLIFLLICPVIYTHSWSQSEFLVEVINDNDEFLTSQGITLPLTDCGYQVTTAVVRYDGSEIPCQLDDLNGDDVFDELFFISDFKSGERKTFNVSLNTLPHQVRYPSEVYVEMMLTNKKIKEENKQDLYISSLTVDNSCNPYWMLHHHGVAFENKLVAYRLYFDHRQTVDIYGKYHRGLELHDTQFYPDPSQKAAGYGDDVLWVGSTFGLGTLRGWDGEKSTMLTTVKHRTQRIISEGPLRTIVEVVDNGWQPENGTETLTMATRYVLQAGRRDCEVYVRFKKAPSSSLFSTGIINVKNSLEYTDHEGLRGCWGTDWPVSAKDSVGHKRETVGLGILLPSEVIRTEQPADKHNYPFVIDLSCGEMTYYVTFGSDNEDFGYHSAEAWFSYLKEWKRSKMLKPLRVIMTSL